jgi:hypothetical protein
MRTITKFEIKKELFICTQVFNLKTRVFFFQKLANIKDKGSRIKDPARPGKVRNIRAIIGRHCGLRPFIRTPELFFSYDLTMAGCGGAISHKNQVTMQTLVAR